jgi:hypothetical protein
MYSNANSLTWNAVVMIQNVLWAREFLAIPIETLSFPGIISITPFRLASGSFIDKSLKMSSAKDLVKDFVRLLKAKTRRKDETSSDPPPPTPVPQASGEDTTPITSIPSPQRKGTNRLTRIFSSKSAGPKTGTTDIEASDAHPGLVRLVQLADSR